MNEIDDKWKAYSIKHMGYPWVKRHEKEHDGMVD
jgi:hypothetical protein